jgi:predicted protein tyrosine phosphatase
MVCPRTRLTEYVNAPVTHFVSLIDPDETEVQPPASAQSQLQLVFSDLDDVEITLPKFAKYNGPNEADVSALIDYGQNLSSLGDWGLLAHCEAGISRSTAAAITILTSAGYRPQTAFGVVRKVCPEMLPNRRILRLTDEALNTGGTLHHMAEIHRRKAFLRAGYEDPTAVLAREHHESLRNEPLRSQVSEPYTGPERRQQVRRESDREQIGLIARFLLALGIWKRPQR